MKIFSKTVNMWLIAALCCLLWGSAFPAIRAGYKLMHIETGDTASIILFAGVRFTLAGIVTIIIFSLIEKKPLFPRKRSVKKIGVLAVFQTVLQYIFFYLGLAFTTGERGAIVNGTSVFFALLISALIFQFEKLNAHKIIGCIIGFAGVILVSLDAFSARETSFIGESFILISSVSYAFSSVFMKKYARNDNPAMLSGWQFVLGGAVMTACALLFGGRLNGFSAKGGLLILYLALVSACAYSLWSILLKYNDVSKVAVCGFMTPVFGFILSALFSQNKANTGILSVLALALVAAGIVTVNSNWRSKAESGY